MEKIFESFKENFIINEAFKSSVLTLLYQQSDKEGREIIRSAADEGYDLANMSDDQFTIIPLLKNKDNLKFWYDTELLVTLNDQVIAKVSYDAGKDKYRLINSVKSLKIRKIDQLFDYMFNTDDIVLYAYNTMSGFKDRDVTRRSKAIRRGEGIDKFELSLEDRKALKDGGLKNVGIITYAHSVANVTIDLINLVRDVKAPMIKARDLLLEEVNKNAEELLGDSSFQLTERDVAIMLHEETLEPYILINLEKSGDEDRLRRLHKTANNNMGTGHISIEVMKGRRDRVSFSYPLDKLHRVVGPDHTFSHYNLGFEDGKGISKFKAIGHAIAESRAGQAIMAAAERISQKKLAVTSAMGDNVKISQGQKVLQKLLKIIVSVEYNTDINVRVMGVKQDSLIVRLEPNFTHPKARAKEVYRDSPQILANAFNKVYGTGTAAVIKIDGNKRVEFLKNVTLGKIMDIYITKLEEIE